MPELPEVELVRRDLETVLVGKQLIAINSLYPTTVHNFTSQPLENLHFGKIEGVRRRGKYLIFDLDSKLQLVSHLRMTGKYVLAEPAAEPTKHTRAVLTLRDGKQLFFIDARTFGHIDIYLNNQPIPALQKLGPEPFDPALTGEVLHDMLQRRKTPIKNALLDQALIAGVGNIYASEALYRAKINPSIPASAVPKKRLNNLIDALRDILRQATELGGTTIKDYRRVDEKRGEFQQYLSVYGQSAAPCGHKVKQIRQAGRSTYFCEKCQK